MTVNADDVYRAGLELGADERVAVARRLLDSISDVDIVEQAEIDAAWDAEIAKRVDEVLSGRVELVSAAESRARVEQLLDELRR